jgi:hypothetical protein
MNMRILRNRETGETHENKSSKSIGNTPTEKRGKHKRKARSPASFKNNKQARGEH